VAISSGRFTVPGAQVALGGLVPDVEEPEVK
jgi:hypothetical protein